MSQHTGRWNYLYNQQIWRNRRRTQLREYPLCTLCETRGQVTPATVVDHVLPHKGDEWLFYNGALQSLCEHCHNYRKKHLEMYGYQRDIGTDGWPLDPAHPANKPRPHAPTDGKLS